MAEARQVSATVDRDWRVEFEVSEYDHMPSWKVNAEGGYAEFKAMMHKKAEWVSLSITESYPADSGKDVVKLTMMSLTPESARGLYEFLHSHFGGAK